MTGTTLYETARLIDEVMTATYRKRYEVEPCGLRFATVDGPLSLLGMKAYGVVQRRERNLADEAAGEKKRREKKKDRKDVQEEGRQSHYLNVGAGSEGSVTWKEVGGVMEKESMWSKGTKAPAGNKKLSVSSIAVSLDLAKDCWKPPTSVAAGIRRVMSWHVQRAYVHIQSNKDVSTADSELLALELIAKWNVQRDDKATVSLRAHVAAGDEDQWEGG